MAKFSFNGMDEISASFEQLSQLSDDDKMSVIMPAAELLKEKHTQKLQSAFKTLTGVLSGSITIIPQQGDSGVSALVTPKGKHPGSSTGKRRGKRRSNGKYSGTNAEIAYILEYGSPRIPASHWMENANEEAEEEVISAQQAAWDNLLTKKGL